MGYNTLIDAATLLAEGNEDWVVLDCRFSVASAATADAGYNAYLEGHIPGALYAHLNNDLSSPVTATSGRHPLPEQQALRQFFGRCGITPETQVVVYDDLNGAMAARCWWLLRWLGHDKVAVLDAGIQAWNAAGGTLEQTKHEQNADGQYPERESLVQVRDADELLMQIQDPRWQLVDARAPERFRGDVEPIDPVGGHIPGAMNRPLQQNLQADGRFKSVEQLRGEWLAILGEASAKEVVHYCGSGVTACHNFLAMEHAGLTGSRVYPGSWSEWSKDPSRPMVKG
ncbi:sulfurtransferase [Pokkaliibacter sp. CJK22405]|uniref:sulfurtransferase n=1 Tax=Pokkaliibacter sp. CJK22405 TaxID=3384615 RepID=UPI0039850E57